jgi:hypothetical protein
MKLLNENAMKEEKDVIVLLGNIKDPKTKDRHEKILALGIGKSNFDLGFTGQLLVRCPKTKVKKLFKLCPIIEGGGYWQATHRWDGATV